MGRKRLPESRTKMVGLKISNQRYEELKVISKQYGKTLSTTINDLVGIGLVETKRERN